jgi:hypothetical protein
VRDNRHDDKNTSSLEKEARASSITLKIKVSSPKEMHLGQLPAPGSPISGSICPLDDFSLTLLPGQQQDNENSRLKTECLHI